MPDSLSKERIPLLLRQYGAAGIGVGLVPAVLTAN
jgi:hypothetical protein